MKGKVEGPDRVEGEKESVLRVEKVGAEEEVS